LLSPEKLESIGVLGPLHGLVQTWPCVYGIIIMCLSHGILFKTKFLGERKYLTAKIDKLMMAPYKRIILIHLVISEIGLLLLTYNADSFLIVILFISAKILFDIYVFKKKT
jgi:hypothetical protein